MVQITEDYVSFETAKLLKKKGFEGRMHTFYTEEGTEMESSYVVPSNFFPIYRPTLQMAMKWLREVYGLFVRITEDVTGNIFEWSVYQKNYGCKVSSYVEDSYEQACEASIKYCLENLI